MLFNTNAWRRINYTALAPIYDRLAAYVAAGRKRAIAAADIQPGERVLLAGAGTGLDLEYLPPGALVTGVDLTPAMLERARKRALRLGRVVDLRVMDAHDLEFADASFDVVLLHLILAVIPDAVRCLKEAERVLRPGGRVVVFDKFQPGRASVGLRLARPVAVMLGTDIARHLDEIVARTTLRMVSEEPGGFGGFYRIAVLRKASSEDKAQGTPGGT